MRRHHVSLHAASHPQSPSSCASSGRGCASSRACPTRTSSSRSSATLRRGASAVVSASSASTGPSTTGTSAPCGASCEGRGGGEGRWPCDELACSPPPSSPPYSSPVASSSGSSCRTSAPLRPPALGLPLLGPLLPGGVHRGPARGAPGPPSSLSRARWRGARLLRRPCRRRLRLLRAMRQAQWVATRPPPPLATQQTTVYPRGAGPSSVPSGRSHRTRSLRPCVGASAALLCWPRPSLRCQPEGQRRAVGGETRAAAAARPQELLLRASREEGRQLQQQQ